MTTNLALAAALFALAGLPAAQLPSPTGLELPAVIPVHTAPDDSAGGAYGVWAAGRDYKASFHDGFAFYPASGTRPEHVFRWRTARIACGSDPVAGLVPTPRLRWSPTRVELDHGAVVEAYDVRAEGVEQTFTLSAPPGSGPLRIKGAIEGGLACAATAAQVGTLTFTAEKAAVRYGAALAIDAAGRRCDVATSFDNGHVVLELGADWLRNAVYPVVVDPLISDGNIHTTTSQRVVSVDVYRDDQETERNLWVTWTVATAAGDLDLITVRLAEQAPALGAITVFADITTSWDAQDGRLAGIGGPGRVITAFVRGFPISHPLPGARRRLVRWHVHGKTDLTLGTTAVGLSAPADEHHWAPVVGGTTAFSVGRFALLVFQRDRAERFFDTNQSDVLATVIDLSLTDQGVAGAPFEIAASQSSDEGRPSINLEEPGGETVRWLVAWQSRDGSSDDADVFVEPVSSEAQGQLVPFRLTTADATDASTDKLDPVLAGSNGRYLLAYRQLDRTGLRDRVRVQRIDWPAGNVPGVLAHPAVTLDGDTNATFALAGCCFDNNTRSHWSLLRARIGKTGNDTRLELDRLGFRGRSLESETVYATLSPLAEFRHPGNVSFNDDADSYRVVFATRELGRDEIQTHRLTTAAVTPESAYGTGCSTASLDWNGTQRIGSQAESLRLRAASSVAAAVLLLGTKTADVDLGPLGMPGCRLLVHGLDGAIGFFPLALANGVGTLPLPLFEELPGLTLRAQAFPLEGAKLAATRGISVALVR